MKKFCNKCNLTKEHSEFHKDNSKKDGFKTICVSCSSLKNKTRKGVVKQIYNSQKYSSRKRNFPLPNYTEQELYNWVNKNDFENLYNNWVNSGHQKNLKPSVDRLNDYKPYTLNNVQLMTWEENKNKGHLDRKNGVNNKHSKTVFKIDPLSNKVIEKFNSTMEAERKTGVAHSSIIKVCSKERKLAGNFKWSYTKPITDGERLFITAHYAFNYDEGHFDHLIQFDILTQFFEHRNNLQGFISDEQGDRVEEYSEVAILMDSLYEAFDNRDIPGTVNRYLHEFEMYEILKDYSEPTSIEGLLFKQELLTVN